MGFAVLLTDDAARDLGEIYDYIAHHDSPQKADRVLEGVAKGDALRRGTPFIFLYSADL